MIRRLPFVPLSPALARLGSGDTMPAARQGSSRSATGTARPLPPTRQEATPVQRPGLAKLVCAGLARPFVDYQNDRLCRIGSGVTLAKVHERLGTIDVGSGFFEGFNDGVLTYLSGGNPLCFGANGNGNHYKGREERNLLYFVGSNFSLNHPVKVRVGDERQEFKGMDRQTFMAAIERHFNIPAHKPYIVRADFSCLNVTMMVARPQENAGGNWSDCLKAIPINPDLAKSTSWLTAGFRLPQIWAEHLGLLASGGHYLHASASSFMGEGQDGGVMGDFIVDEVSCLVAHPIDEVVEVT